MQMLFGYCPHNKAFEFECCSEERVMRSKWQASLLGFFLCILALGTTVNAVAAEYYVAPDGNNDNPGSEISPFKTIQHGLGKAEAGDVCIVRAGIYREHVTLDKSGTPTAPIVLTAAPGERVVVTGADELKHWQRDEGDDNVFYTTWPYTFILQYARRAHPDNDHHSMIGRAEQVHVNGYALLQVLRRDQMSRGTFCVDEENKRLYVWERGNADLAVDTQNGRLRVEASSRSAILTVTGSQVHIKGLVFRYAANSAQAGAVKLAGNDITASDCVIERTNATGVGLHGERTLLKRCVIQSNGQLGFRAMRAHGLRLEDCVVRDNNIKDWNRNWEAGANKILLCRDVVFEHSIFTENRGHGVWFDIGNENCTVRNCLIANNEHAGIFYEISYGLHAYDNVIVGNGHDSDSGAWAANGGIAISSSPGCIIERNLLMGNYEGLQFREQPRRTETIEENQSRAVWNHDEQVRNNLFAWNSAVQVAGWFDIADARHWPKALQREMGGPSEGPTTDAAAEYKAKTDDGQPTGLALEDLNLDLDGNVFALRHGQGLYRWGCTWHPNKAWNDLDGVRAVLAQEETSQIIEIQFSNAMALDLRIPQSNPVWKEGVYPKGEVPGVKLGRVE
jgi:hypothetical protein